MLLHIDTSYVPANKKLIEDLTSHVSWSRRNSQVKGVLDRCIDRVESDLRKAAAEKAKKMLPPKSKEERDREAVRDDLYKPARTSLTICAFSACLSPPLSL